MAAAPTLFNYGIDLEKYPATNWVWDVCAMFCLDEFTPEMLELKSIMDAKSVEFVTSDEANKLAKEIDETYQKADQLRQQLETQRMNVIRSEWDKLLKLLRKQD